MPISRNAQARLEGLVTEADILVIATHDMAIVTDWCSRAIRLESGHIVDDGPVDQVVLAAELAARPVEAA